MVRAMTFAEENKDFVIRNVIGNEKTKSKLVQRGFCVGEKLCLLKGHNDNYIVKINESKYVLNFSLANKILVEEV